MVMQEVSRETNHRPPVVKFSKVDETMTKYMAEAKRRIFSLAAGNRIGKIAPEIMQVGFSKILYAAEQLGADIDNNKPFVLFAPDGTCTYNIERIKRGFTYGAILDFEFDGMMATNNSMANGCGFSIFELEDPIDDEKIKPYLKDAQKRLGSDQLTQLGKGNHFAGIYYVNDPVTGEDTGRRFVIVHCSGHVDGNMMYFPEQWLAEEEGYHSVDTPHGIIRMLEGEARNRYMGKFKFVDDANAKNRVETMGEIFPDMPWKTLEEITHQGYIKHGSQHVIGMQKHDGLMPIAFNPEEGLVAVKHKPNLNQGFLSCWKDGDRARSLGMIEKMQGINMTPHGAGYEFRYPVNSLEITLGTEGIHQFNADLQGVGSVSYAHFREIREHMTYRRRAPIMREVDRADLAEIIFEMPGLMQIYPLKSIPGGSH